MDAAPALRPARRTPRLALSILAALLLPSPIATARADEGGAPALPPPGPTFRIEPAVRVEIHAFDATDRTRAALPGAKVILDEGGPRTVAWTDAAVGTLEPHTLGPDRRLVATLRLPPSFARTTPSGVAYRASGVVAYDARTVRLAVPLVPADRAEIAVRAEDGGPVKGAAVNGAWLDGRPVVLEEEFDRATSTLRLRGVPREGKGRLALAIAIEGRGEVFGSAPRSNGSDPAYRASVGYKAPPAPDGPDPDPTTEEARRRLDADLEEIREDLRRRIKAGRELEDPYLRRSPFNSDYKDCKLPRRPDPTMGGIGSLRVRIVDAAGRALEGLPVRLTRQEAPVERERTAVTGPGGEVVFDGLPPGRFLVDADAPGLVPIRGAMEVPQGAARALVVQERAHDRASPRVVAADGGAVPWAIVEASHGKVLPRADAAGAQWLETLTDADGIATVHWIPGEAPELRARTRYLEGTERAGLPAPRDAIIVRPPRD